MDQPICWLAMIWLLSLLPGPPFRGSKLSWPPPPQALWVPPLLLGRHIEIFQPMETSRFTRCWRNMGFTWEQPPVNPSTIYKCRGARSCAFPGVGCLHPYPYLRHLWWWYWFNFIWTKILTKRVKWNTYISFLTYQSYIAYHCQAI